MNGPIERFIKGQTRIRLQGTGAIRCLNLLLGQDAQLRDIRRKENGIEAWISTEQRKEVKRYAGKSGCGIEILREKGLPAWKRRYGNRYGFALGIALAIVLMFFLNCYIWQIDIQGNQSISDTEVLSRLSQYDLKQGVWKNGMDLEKAKNALLLEYPEWSWLSLSIEGSTLQVRLEEATIPPEVYTEGVPMDLTADRDGIIYSIITKKGTPMVRSGDVVKKGDILISGTIEIEMEDGSKKYEYTQASGDVYASCAYVCEQEQRKDYLEKIYTGDTANELVLRLDEQEIVLYRPFRNFENTDRIEEALGREFMEFLEEIPGFPNMSLFRRTYVFYETEPKTYREDQLKVLLSAALQKKRDALVEERQGTLLEEEIDYEKTSEGLKGISRVKILEKIGELTELTPVLEKTEE